MDNDREVFPVIITKPNHWYSKFIGEIFDVRKSEISQYKYDIELTERTKAVGENYYKNTFFGSIVVDYRTGENRYWDSLWIHSSHCKRLDEINDNESIKSILHSSAFSEFE